MKLFLFGGAERGQVADELKLISDVINQINPKQILHIPFASTVPRVGEWEDGWFDRNIKLNNTVYLNAQNERDVAKTDHPLIFISGGSQNVNLKNQIESNPKLLGLIQNADYIIGESSGAMVLGQHYRSGKLEGPSKLITGLGIIKNTIIAPHYTERNKQEQLAEDVKETGVAYGVGIDAVTAMEFELDKFPEEYTKIGTGLVEIKKYK